MLGVGADNYGNSTIHYLLRAGRPDALGLLRRRPDKVAHNVYLQVMAELGVVGLALFLGIVAFALQRACRAARRFGRRGERSLELLTRALLIAPVRAPRRLDVLVGLYSKQMWLLLALAVAIGGRRARRSAA